MGYQLYHYGISAIPYQYYQYMMLGYINMIQYDHYGVEDPAIAID